MKTKHIPRPVKDESLIHQQHHPHPPKNASFRWIHFKWVESEPSRKPTFPRNSLMGSNSKSVDRGQRQLMYFVCTKCHRLFRDVNTSKHVNKCRGTTFRCVDCDEEFRVQDIPQHTDCPKAMKSVAPPLYNPKSVFSSLCLSM